MKDTRRTDMGAALVLVMIFMIVGGLIIGALTSAVTNDLGNTRNFASARSLQYDALNATDMAIESIRYAPLLSTSQTLNASPPSSCGSNAVFQVTGSNDTSNIIDVWCSTAWNAMSIATRVVTLSACPNTVGAADCAASPVLQAVVSFDDYPVGASASAAAPCVVYCGAIMSINSWVRSPAVPIVTGISPASGSATGGTTVTIAGSGFVSGSTVSLVEESGGTPTGDNVILPATDVEVSSPTSITAVSPPVTSGTAYFVTVNTPAGTSGYSSNDIFTY